MLMLFRSIQTQKETEKSTDMRTIAFKVKFHVSRIYCQEETLKIEKRHEYGLRLVRRDFNPQVEELKGSLIRRVEEFGEPIQQSGYTFNYANKSRKTI